MSKQVAILTQPLGHNYGGIIQNFALQSILISYGYIPTTINRKKISHGSNNLLYNLKVLIKFYLFSNRKGVPKTSKNWKRIYSENNRFMKSHLCLSYDIYNENKFIKFIKSKNFDAYIVGSDQVWRPKYSPNIYTYFLDFVSNSRTKKISYAASFGSDDWEFNVEQTQRCQILAKNFNAISVRELDGVRLCRTYLDVDSLQVLDPTLLLDSSIYSELINRPEEDKGLFTYVLDDSSEKGDFIFNCSNRLGLEINNSQSLGFEDKRSNDVNDFVVPPIENWLQGFRDAKFVITDSFHGTLFSIINRKPFISIINSKRGASRFYSILELLGLKSRIVEDVTSFDYLKLHEIIDFDKVHKILDNERKKSLDFIFSNI